MKGRCKRIFRILRVGAGAFLLVGPLVTEFRDELMYRFYMQIARYVVLWAWPWALIRHLGLEELVSFIFNTKIRTRSRLGHIFLRVKVLALASIITQRVV